MDSVKSREIPINDLFHNLQLEWISYYIRSQIYNRDFDIKKFDDICKMKKEKIDTFSLRNSISSIFTKDEKMQKFLDEFYPQETNKVNFEYTPKNQKLKLWDKFHFYKFGTIFEFEEKEIKIIKNDTYSDEVEFITEHREHKRVPYKEVRRDITILFD